MKKVITLFAGLLFTLLSITSFANTSNTDTWSWTEKTGQPIEKEKAMFNWWITSKIKLPSKANNVYNVRIIDDKGLVNRVIALSPDQTITPIGIDLYKLDASTVKSFITYDNFYIQDAQTGTPSLPFLKVVFQRENSSTQTKYTINLTKIDYTAHKMFNNVSFTMKTVNSYEPSKTNFINLDFAYNKDCTLEQAKYEAEPFSYSWVGNPDGSFSNEDYNYCTKKIYFYYNFAIVTNDSCAAKLTDSENISTTAILDPSFEQSTAVIKFNLLDMVTKEELENKWEFDHHEEIYVIPDVTGVKDKLVDISIKRVYQDAKWIYTVYGNVYKGIGQYTKSTVLSTIFNMIPIKGVKNIDFTGKIFAANANI